ncbi:MAG: hypothetical protein GX410_02290 [Elusimicrobia bacterium]|nr:hypothetical protein [Elusimicrobiota bacterium]
MTNELIAGTLLGLFSGLLSAYFVERARLHSSPAVFFRVWGAALLSRCMFVGAAFAAVWTMRVAHPAAFLLSLVIAQTAAQFVKPPKVCLRK